MRHLFLTAAAATLLFGVQASAGGLIPLSHLHKPTGDNTEVNLNASGNVNAWVEDTNTVIRDRTDTNIGSGTILVGVTGAGGASIRNKNPGKEPVMEDAVVHYLENGEVVSRVVKRTTDKYKDIAVSR